MHKLVESCAAATSPTLKLVTSDAVEQAGAVAVLSGSFNPLTRGHLALGEAADSHSLGPVLFALSTHTIDKAVVEGAVLEDRLLVLSQHGERTANRLVGLLNRGLYVDQAELLQESLPDLHRLTFLVGFDKIVQIFDPRYYRDREPALERLFGLASFAVAPRAGADRADLARLLEAPENRRFAAGVSFLEVDPALAGISSSAIRAALARGERAPAELAPESLAFIEATGCYRVTVAGELSGDYLQRRKFIQTL